MAKSREQLEEEIKALQVELEIAELDAAFEGVDFSIFAENVGNIPALPRPLGDGLAEEVSPTANTSSEDCLRKEDDE